MLRFLIALCFFVANAAAFGLSPVALPSSGVGTVRHNVREITMIRHGKKVAKLGRPADQRKAMLRSLTTEVIRHGRVRTTEARAKAVRKYVDKMVSLGKDGSLHARRQAIGFLYDKELVHALFEQAGERYGDREGGYCRVLKDIKPRRGDAARTAVIELV